MVSTSSCWRATVVSRSISKVSESSSSSANAWARVPLYLSPVFLIPSITAFCQGDTLGTLAFLVSGACCCALAALSLHLSRKGQDKPSPGASPARAAATWVLISIPATLPFWAYGHWSGSGSELETAYGSVSRAWFEAMSGLTSTGLSMSSSASTLPNAIQLWRSLLQWIGGYSLILFAVVLGAEGQWSGSAQAEFGADFDEGDPRKQAKAYVLVYAGLTVGTCLLFTVVGVPVWEAVNHSLTSVSTGGFTIRDDSYASYDGAARSIGLTASIAGALSWATYLQLGKGKFRSLMSSSQLRSFLAFTAGLIGLMVVLAARRNPSLAIGDVIFEAISASTTCGISVAGSRKDWVSALVAVPILAMIIGGCSGSTTGGIKHARLALLEAGVRRLIRRGDVDDSDQTKHLEGILSASGLALLWLVTLVVGWLPLAIAFPDEAPLRMLFDVTSAVGGVGLDAGFIDASRPSWVLVWFTILMWLGRLELLGGIFLLLGRAQLFRSQESK